MAQIVKEPGWGENLGQAFGTGLGKGLNALAQYKMGQLLQRKKTEIEERKKGERVKGLSAFFGPEKGAMIANLPDQQQLALLKMAANLNPELLQNQEGQEGQEASSTGIMGSIANMFSGDSELSEQVSQTISPSLDWGRLLSPGKEMVPEPSPVKITKSSDIGSLRKKYLPLIKKGSITKDAAIQQLSNTGLDGDAINAILGTELTPEITKTFLDLAKGNMKMAKKLAKRAGYKF